jgi:hypothetical protein
VVEFNIFPPRSHPQLPYSHFYEWVSAGGIRRAQFYRTENGYLLRFPDLAEFEISADASSVACFPAPNVQDATPHHLYINQVLPLVLSKLGKAVFHASAVEAADGAIAFLAEAGRGKSTLAAHFVANNYRFLTDDALVLEACERGYQAMPGDPAIRLWEDTAKMLSETGAELAPPLHFTKKTRFLTGPHCDKPRPLRAAYFLGDRSAKDIIFRRLGPAETLMKWAKNSFLLDVEAPSMVAAHFDRTAALSNSLAGYHLDYPRRFGDLAALRIAIVEHATSRSPAT